MKKLMALVCVLCLVGCRGTQKSQTVEIIIPAGYKDAFEFSDEAIEANAFIYSEEVISPKRNTLTIKAGAGRGLKDSSRGIILVIVGVLIYRKIKK